jgi:hypothetical protein
MKFVQKHFTKHHFLHAPHKWFLAFLLSPVHFCEVHYQKRYHLQFAHARKLFLFDMCLLASVFVIALTWISVLMYDPTVTKNIEISLSTTSEKIKNGEEIFYEVKYKNTSSEKLVESEIVLNLPKGFVFLEAKPREQFRETTKTFVLPALAPGAGGNVTVTGIYFGNANEKDVVAADFSYKQETRGVRENKMVTMFTTARGSILETTITSAPEVIENGKTKVLITLKNTGNVVLENVSQVISVPNGKIEESSEKLSEKNVWTLEKKMEPGSTATLNFSFTPTNLGEKKETHISVLPEIVLGNSMFVLDSPITHLWKVLTPNIRFGAGFDGGVSVVSPGEVLKTNIVIKNQGDIHLMNAVVTIPLSNFIDTKKLLELNRGTLDATGFHVSSKFVASLLDVAPLSEVKIPLEIPLKHSFEGKDVVMKVNASLEGVLKNVEGTFRSSAESEGVKVRTKLLVDASARYFTVDGDQLGRGPLPPRVGKQTKYGVIVRASNTTSRVENLSFSAVIPSYVQWTGRATASVGKEPVFDGDSRMVTWNALALGAGESVSLYVELGLTPVAGQIGTTPLLIRDIRLRADDTFTLMPVEAKARDVDVSIFGDEIGRVKGVRVIE